MADLTAQRAAELINFDPETGAFRWKPRAGRGGSWCNVDREAGSVSKQTGYRTIRLGKKLYQAHRIAWLLVNGEWPALDIDHINGDRLDNRIANLRVVPNAINRQNMRRARSDSQTGMMGVTQDKRRGNYFARVRLNGKTHHLGSFPNAQDAHAAYLNAKRRLHVGCTI